MPNWISFSSADQIEASGTRGVFNFVAKCPECKKEGSISISSAKDTIEWTEGLIEVASFDFRGFKPLDYRASVTSH